MTSDIFAKTRARIAEREAALRRYMDEHGESPFSSKLPDGRTVLVGPDPKKPGRWRITFLEGRRLKPVGHVELESFVEAARLALRDYYATLPTTPNVRRDPMQKTRSRRDAARPTIQGRLSDLATSMLLGYSVTRALDALAKACRRKADAIDPTMGYGRTAKSDYLYAARTIESCTQRIRERAETLTVSSP